jgi:predicted HTH transcriptional regulator
VTDDTRFRELLAIGREDRFLECKQGVAWDSLKVKIARTALAMANLRDGGTIVVGVSQATDGTLRLEGISAADLDTYNPDDVQAFVNRFADPYVKLELNRRSLDGKSYVELTVYEFDEVPVVCRADFGSPGGNLRKGAFYVRSTRMPETTELQSQTEMREILQLAIDKGVRQFLRRAEEAGISIESQTRRAQQAAFKRQRGDL